MDHSPNRRHGGNGAGKLTEAQKDQIVEDYRNFQSFSAIARKFGVQYPSIRRVLMKRGVPLRVSPCSSYKLTDEEKQEILQRYQQGENCPQIAARFDLNPSTVRDHLIRNKVRVRGAGETKRKPGWPNEQKQRQLRHQERREKGLCPLCGQRPPLPNRKHCAVCTRRRRELIAWRRSAGKCSRCGMFPPVRSGECERCRERSKLQARARVQRYRLTGRCPCGRPVVLDAARCAICLEGGRRRRQRFREKALAAYGGACACCGESEQAFLTIDHMNNDGAKHKRAIGTSTIYPWLCRNGFPPGFQVLCFNCNCAKYILGECPHKRRQAPS